MGTGITETMLAGVKTMMMICMIMMAVTVRVGMARVVVDPVFLEWILDQETRSGHTVREWRDHYAQWDDAACALYYSTRAVYGQVGETEQW